MFQTKPEAMHARGRALLALIGSLLGLWTIWATMVLPTLSPSYGLAGELRGLLVRLLLWVVPCGIYLWSQHRRDWWVPLRLRLPPPGPRLTVSIVITAMASLAISLNVARELGVSPGVVWELWLVSYEPELPATPFFEELVFRGVVFSELLLLLVTASDNPGDSAAKSSLRRWRAAWAANLMASLVFVGAHWPYWIYQEGLGMTLLLRSIPILLLSLVLGMLFARGSSIWPCIVLHWINNELSSMLPGM